MIDTIVIRVHNIEKNHLLMHNILKEEFISAKVRHSHNQTLDKKAIIYGDSGKVLPLTIHTKMKMPSSHYELNLRPHFDRDFIEFNFSIPKFVYSTNVMQFVDMRDQTPEFTYDKLLHFLHHFFITYFTLKPDNKDIEINRIDLCFNQIFDTKENALRYLEEQKNINIKHANSDTNKFVAYSESDDLGVSTAQTIFYKTKEYSFKIYHKGSEFKKNDLKQLMKANPFNLHLGEVSDLADRMLRYELTARKGLFNYLLDRVDTLENQERVKFVNDCNLYYRKKGVDKFTFTYSFFLESDFDCYIDYKFVSVQDMSEMKHNTFSKGLFLAVYNWFWDRVKTYQISLKMSVADISNLIMQKYDEKKTVWTAKEREKELGNQSQLVMLALLTQFTDIHALKGIIPDRTFYRYKKRLKTLGIEPNSHTNIFDIPVLTYDRYFDLFRKYLNINY
ncbi:hypothetical protein [Flavobacterium phage FLiP]|uniref:Replication-associated protein G2P N-terminal domain-containing protein n=1 Tax=Flavobacterium phage FLiP TaxID=2023716 RepID=A0A222NP71_9VIRU|nr:hypothetical protein HOR88_gp15 [Flavobacterium phage FLiP]ASQ41212.1 hypothetical protein [Flavobacterium phage FLiP]